MRKRKRTKNRNSDATPDPVTLRVSSKGVDKRAERYTNSSYKLFEERIVSFEFVRASLKGSLTAV